MRGSVRNRPAVARRLSAVRRGRRATAAVAGVPLSLRGAAAMPAAALAVHQLRYKLAYGAGASHALAQQGHAYLTSLVPWIVLLATLSAGAALGRFARRWGAGADTGTRSGRTAGVRVWLVASAALFAVYAGQELLEGLFASGHLGGLAAVLGAGGWWAVPVALLVGGVLALVLRGAHAVERALDAARRGVRVIARGLGELVSASAGGGVCCDRRAAGVRRCGARAAASPRTPRVAPPPDRRRPAVGAR